jgi:hypothetical protein
MDNYDMRSFQIPLLKKEPYDDSTEGDKWTGNVAYVVGIKKDMQSA